MWGNPPRVRISYPPPKLKMEYINFFQESKPYFVILHILGVFIGMGGALFADVAFSFFGRDKELSVKELLWFDRISKMVWFGLGIIIISGIGIFFSDPGFYLISSKFLSKMTVVLVLTINGFVLYKFVQPALVEKDFLVSIQARKIRRLAFICGSVSLVSWLSALALALQESLPFSYLEIVSVYSLVLVVGVIVSLIFEKYIFSKHAEDK